MSHLLLAGRLRPARRLSLVLVAASLIGACSGPPSPWPAANIASGRSEDGGKSQSQAKADAGSNAALVVRAYADPKDPAVVVKAARALKSEGKRGEALALLEATLASHPTDGILMRETGLLSLEQGLVGKAEPLLRKALQKNKADWQTHSALGVALASAGKHQEAQRSFAKALALAPDHPSILNNLALSYALDGKPANAERILRVVVATKDTPSAAKQNLALVLGAEGKLVEAQGLAKGILPEAQTAANAQYLKALADRANAGRPIRSADARKEQFTPPYSLGAVSSK